MQTLLTFLLVASAKAAVLVLLVLAANVLLSHWIAARWRYLLWGLVALRLVLPPLLPSGASLFNLWALGMSLASSPATPAQALVSPAVVPPPMLDPEPSPAAAVPAEVPAPVPATPLLTADPVLAPAAASPKTALESEPGTSAAVHSLPWRIHVSPWLAGFALWLAGVVALLGAMLVRHGRLAARVRHETRIAAPAVLELLAVCQAELKMSGVVAVVETPAVQSPALLGIFRPRLLLPAGLAASLGREELRHVILHELAHHRRRDIAVNWLMALVQALHWFNPFVWLAFHRMRQEQELACDETVLAALRPEERRRYGHTLLALTESFPRHGIAGGVGILENTDHLVRRLEQIRGYRPSGRFQGWLAAMLFLGLGALALTEARPRIPPHFFQTLAVPGGAVVVNAREVYPPSLGGYSVMLYGPPATPAAPQGEFLAGCLRQDGGAGIEKAVLADVDGDGQDDVVVSGQSGPRRSASAFAFDLRRRQVTLLAELPNLEPGTDPVAQLRQAQRKEETQGQEVGIPKEQEGSHPSSIQTQCDFGGEKEKLTLIDNNGNGRFGDLWTLCRDPQGFLDPDLNRKKVTHGDIVNVGTLGVPCGMPFVKNGVSWNLSVSSEGKVVSQRLPGEMTTIAWNGKSADLFWMASSRSMFVGSMFKEESSGVWIIPVGEYRLNEFHYMSESGLPIHAVAEPGRILTAEAGKPLSFGPVTEAVARIVVQPMTPDRKISLATKVMTPDRYCLTFPTDKSKPQGPTLRNGLAFRILNVNGQELFRGQFNDWWHDPAVWTVPKDWQGDFSVEPVFPSGDQMGFRFVVEKTKITIPPVAPVAAAPRFEVDREKCAALGVSVQKVAEVVGQWDGKDPKALEGMTVETMDGKKVRVLDLGKIPLAVPVRGGEPGQEGAKAGLPVDDFFKLCASGSAEQVKAAIAAGADVNAKDKDGKTPLMAAATACNDPQVISLLAQAGAKVNAQDNEGMTPLLLAAKSNSHPEIIAALVKAGGSLSMGEWDGMKSPMVCPGNTPLMCAAESNSNPKVVEALLQAGSGVNWTDRRGCTALMYAARSTCNPEVIQVLLRAGADVNRGRPKTGVTPLIEAAGNNPNPEIVKALMKAGARVNDCAVASTLNKPPFWHLTTTYQHQNPGNPRTGRTALKAACRSNNAQVVAALVAGGADVNDEDQDGGLPLMIAAQNARNGGCVAVLANAGARVNVRDQSGKTPLMYVRHAEDAEALIRAGADVNARDNAGESCLHYGRLNGGQAVVDLLLKAGAK